MNMNKKLFLLIVFFLCFFIVNLNVYAGKCSDINISIMGDGTDECHAASEDGFKCKSETRGETNNIRHVCEKSNECIENYKSVAGKCLPDLDKMTTQKTKKCHEINDENACLIGANCRWNEKTNTCEEDYVANEPCSDKNILTVLNFFGYLILIARVAIPLILIVIGILDIFKAVTANDDKMLSKQVKLLGVRIVGGIFVFFIPTLVYAIFEMSSDLDIVSSSNYKKCVNCVLKPNLCIIDNNNNNNNNNNQTTTTKPKITCNAGQFVGPDSKCHDETYCKNLSTQTECMYGVGICQWYYNKDVNKFVCMTKTEAFYANNDNSNCNQGEYKAGDGNCYPENYCSTLNNWSDCKKAFGVCNWVYDSSVGAMACKKYSL